MSAGILRSMKAQVRESSGSTEALRAELADVAASLAQARSQGRSTAALEEAAARLRADLEAAERRSASNRRALSDVQSVVPTKQ